MLMGLFTKDSGSTIRYVLIVFNFFHSRERIKKISGFAAAFAGCVWTKAVSGKKRFADKSRIRKEKVCEFKNISIPVDRASIENGHID